MLIYELRCCASGFKMQSLLCFQVLNRDSPKTTKPTTANQTTTSAPPMEEPVQLRRGQGQQRGSGVNKKKCRVLFSYQPKHEDELELKVRIE